MKTNNFIRLFTFMAVMFISTNCKPVIGEFEDGTDIKLLTNIPIQNTTVSLNQLVLPKSTQTTEPEITDMEISTSDVDISQYKAMTIRDCIEEQSEPFTEMYGSAVYQFGYNQALLLDLASGAKILLEDASPIMAVSPDHKKLAYTSEDPAQLHIVDINGKQQKKESIPEDWNGVIQWADNNNILIQRFLNDPYREASVIRYNIEKGFQEEYLPSYPKFSVFVNAKFWANYSYSRMIFDSNMTRVIYPDTTQNIMNLALYDLTTEEVLLISYGFPQSGVPQWISNSSGFIAGLYPKWISSSGIKMDNELDDLPYKGGYDLFRVSKDAEIERLTYFSTYSNASQEQFTLSPKEDKVAFWLVDLNSASQNYSNTSEFAILDIPTKKVTNLCFSSQTPFVYPIIWSPDGRYLILAMDNSFSTAYIDLKEKKVYKIYWEDSQAAIGWLIP